MNIHGPYQPKINMAVALKRFETDVDMDEKDIEFTSVKLEKIGIRELVFTGIVSVLVGIVLGVFLL